MMIEVENLHRSYGDTRALRGVSFEIPKGQVVGLLGPNGAGKTTTMKILVGALVPDEGRAHVAGYDVLREPIAVQSRLGYLPENAPLYGDMLVQDYLGFVGRMHALDGGALQEGLARVVKDCGIAEVLTRPIAQLSKGYRQRVGLASALVHDPPLLILDEPTGGLDPNQIVEVRELIRRLARDSGKTVILSTHILPEVEATCERAIIVIDGQKRADGTLEELTRSRTQVVTLNPDDPERARERLGRLSGVRGVQSVEREDGAWEFRLDLDEERDIGRAVSEFARSEGWPLSALYRDDRSLEQVFRELTQTAGRAGA